jgi:hypothetical protein
MYYEEKVIDGVLHFRTVPNGGWTAFGAVALTGMLMKAEAALKTYQQ